MDVLYLLLANSDMCQASKKLEVWQEGQDIAKQNQKNPDYHVNPVKMNEISYKFPTTSRARALGATSFWRKFLPS